MRGVVSAIVALVVGAGCTADDTGEDDDGYVDDSVEIVHGPGDFLGAVEGGRVGVSGIVESATYATYGLRGRGYLGSHVTATTTFADLAPLLATPARGEAYRMISRDFGADRPRGLGLGRADDFTIILDGEIRLTAGSNALGFDADDVGFVELELDGEVVTVRSSGGAVEVDVPHDGWFPIRGAMSESTGDADFALRQNGVPVLPASLRFETTAAHGLELLGAPSEELAETVVTIVATGLPVGPIGTGPADLELPASFALRFEGEILVPTSTTYALWIETVAGAEPVTHVMTSAQGLASWYPLTIDLIDVEASTEVVLLESIDGGPAQPVSFDHLRPSVELLENDWDTQFHGVELANGGAIALELAPNHVLRGIPDVASRAWFSMSLSWWSGLASNYTAELELAPDDVRPLSFDLSGNELIASLDLGTAVPLSPPWVIRIGNDLPESPGSFSALDTTTTQFRWGEGTQPTAANLVYTSQPFATPRGDSLRTLEVGATVWNYAATEVRSANTLAQLESAEWYPAVTGNYVPIREVTQYRVTVAAPLSGSTSVAFVKLRYQPY